MPKPLATSANTTEIYGALTFGPATLKYSHAVTDTFGKPIAKFQAAWGLAKGKSRCYGDVFPFPLFILTQTFAHRELDARALGAEEVQEFGLRRTADGGRTWTYAYTPAGDLASVTDPETGYALTADQVAEVAEFFSFGTNDLTQMTMGFSRDDAGKFLPDYLRNGIYEHDPFRSIDQKGVGVLVEMAVQKGRGSRPGLETGVCGEHGGDPASVAFFHRAGLDYVSCSPYRVPIARLAAAQAALGG